MIIQPTNHQPTNSSRSPLHRQSTTSSLEIVIYSDELGEITVDGEEDEVIVLPNNILHEHEELVFDMDEDIQHQQHSNNIDMQVQYYTPILETHGLSQSVDIYDHDYLHQHILNIRQGQEEEEEEDSGIYEYGSYEQGLSSYTVPFPSSSTEENQVYSQSAPTTWSSFLLDYLPEFLFTSSENHHHPVEEEEDQVVPNTENDIHSGEHHIVQSDSSTSTITYMNVQYQKSPEEEDDRPAAAADLSPSKVEGGGRDGLSDIELKDIVEKDLAVSKKSLDTSSTPLPQMDQPPVADTYFLQPSEEKEPSSCYISQPQANRRDLDKRQQSSEKYEVVVVGENHAMKTGESRGSSSIQADNSLQQRDIVGTATHTKTTPEKPSTPEKPPTPNFMVTTQQEPADQEENSSTFQERLDMEAVPYKVITTPSTNLIKPTYSFPDDSRYKTWRREANRHYRTNSHGFRQVVAASAALIASRNKLFHRRRAPPAQQWQMMHQDSNAYSNVTRNPFIFECTVRHACGIKVMCISKYARFKDIQAHFFDPNVVFIRYIRIIQCAYVVYRNYQEMVKARFSFNETEICGKKIYCRPAFYGELEKDNKLHSQILNSQVPPPTKDMMMVSAGTPNTTKYFDTRRPVDVVFYGSTGSGDTFIPERHGFVHRSSKRTKQLQQRRLSQPRYPPPTTVCITNTTTTMTTTTTTATTAVFSARDILKMLAQYRPDQQIGGKKQIEASISSRNTTADGRFYMKELFKTINMREHYYYFSCILPSISNSYIANMPQYVIIKPWARQDLLFSQQSGYWSVTPKNAVLLNYLFNTSAQVDLLFNMKSSGHYQGYAVMKSEVIDLCSLNYPGEVIGTPFQKRGEYFKTAPGNRSWRFAFRVEWKSKEKINSKKVESVKNPWNKNAYVKFSKDCSIIEPRAGNLMMKKLAYSFS